MAKPPAKAPRKSTPKAGSPKPASPKPSPRKPNPPKPGPRKALVTGATSGIGHATALGLAQAGLEVTLLVRDLGRGEAARQRIQENAPGATVHLLEGDLASQRSVRRAAAAFAKANPDLQV